MAERCLNCNSMLYPDGYCPYHCGSINPLLNRVGVNADLLPIASRKLISYSKPERSNKIIICIKCSSELYLYKIDGNVCPTCNWPIPETGTIASKEKSSQNVWPDGGISRCSSNQPYFPPANSKVIKRDDLESVLSEPLKCTAYGCTGVFHPATGHIFSDTERCCGICAGQYFAWRLKREGWKPRHEPGQRRFSRRH